MLTGVDLQRLREEIEEIDRDLLAQIKRRMALVEHIATTKLERAFPFRDHQREERVLQRVRRVAVRLGLDPHAIERLYRLIMEMSISHQQAHVRSLTTVPLRVAYQGVEGSYSHLAAQQRFAGRSGGALLTGFDTFRGATHAVRTGAADLALLPIENTTAGSVIETYDLLAEGGLVINAEVVSRVEHCLVTMPEVGLEELRKVISHPQALMQCETYLRSVPWIRPEAEFDTAGAARKVRERGERTLAAIASESAASMLGLTVLRKGIQSQASNATRFVEVAIEASPCPPDVPCKTSLMVVLGQSAAQLGEVLSAFGRRGMRLTKLESRPIPDSPWKYRFHLDLEAHADDAEMVAALESIRSIVSELRIFGTYPKAD